MELAPLAPLALGWLTWRDAAGVTQLTAIAKATFEIRPDHTARIVEPYPLFGDVHFEENPGRSLRVASDFAPRKARVDVLFTGAAYAPVGEHVSHRSIRFAMAVAGKSLFDRRLLAIGSRERDRAGTPTPPQPFAYLPLRWELAYGGASSAANPIGVGGEPGDPRLPSIVDPADPKKPAGLGAIPASWPVRRSALGGADPAALAALSPAIRAGIDLAYFNAAPLEQQLAALRGDEQVLMSGLHPTLSEIAWRLPGTRAHAQLDLRGACRPVALEIDTLWIEGETLRATVTWRGAVALEASDVASLDTARLRATLAKGDVAPTWDRPRARVDAPSLIGGPSAAEGASIFQRSSSIELEMEHSILYAPKSDAPLRVPRRVTPMPPIVNDAGLPAWTIPWQVRPTDYVFVVVVKATYAIGDDGGLTLCDEQPPPSGDVSWDAEENVDDLAGPGAGSLRYASDFAVFKPSADVLLVGSAHPVDPAVGVTNVELRLGNLVRRIAVFGDRKWGGFGLEGKPAPFETIPLRWERAMGGPLSEANPAGRGFKTGVVPPNLERGEALVRGPDDRPAPACFAPVPVAWKARASKVGTYDAAWLKDRWPYLPADFDWSYFNAAPPEQQVPYLRGTERYAVVGVRPGGKGFQGQLPGLRPRVFAQRTEEVGGEFFEVLLRLDTAAFDTDARRLTLVWRGMFATPDDDAPDIAALFVDREQGDTTRTLDEARARALARVAAGDILPAAALVFPDEPPPAPRRKALPAPPVAPTRAAVLADVAAGKSLAGADLTGADLAGADLTGVDLTGALLAGATLTDAVLDRAKLKGAVLAGARAERATFVEADLTEADLTGASLVRADLGKAQLVRAALDQAKADGAIFAGARGEQATFVGASLQEAKLDGADLSGADFTRAVLSDASLRKARLDDVRLYDARARGAVFDGATMVRARADRASLPGASLRGVTAPQSVWESADLSGASLQEASLPEAIFVRAKLEKASLVQATATGANFQRANLRGVHGLRANLMGARLERADLTEADLRGANLHGAETWRARTAHVDLAGAVVTGSKLART